MIFALCLIAVPLHDGDSFTCADHTKIRLERINAPDFEFAPPCRKHKPGYVCSNNLARAARDRLRALAPVGTVIRYEPVDADLCRAGFQATDRYGRVVARAWVGGIDLSEYQLRGGVAGCRCRR
jgi:endonuclease YncB( thermonuclease family)